MDTPYSPWRKQALLDEQDNLVQLCSLTWDNKNPKLRLNLNLKNKLKLNLCVLYIYTNLNFKQIFKDYYSGILSYLNTMFSFLSMKTLFIIENIALQ